MRSRLAVALGAFYVLLGVMAAISPEWFVTVVDWGTRAGQLVAAGIRVVAGGILLLAASTSRFPRTFSVFGAIALVAGLLIPVLPIEFWAEYMHWWMVDQLQPFRAVMFIAGTAFGAFIIYGAKPRHADAE